MFGNFDSMVADPCVAMTLIRVCVCEAGVKLALEMTLQPV